MGNRIMSKRIYMKAVKQNFYLWDMIKKRSLFKYYTFFFW